jgi:hypothetical protein
VVRITDAAPGCVAPSLYLLPLAKAGDYLGVIDFLGGGIGDPSILNIGRPSIALSYDGGEKVDPLAGQRAEPAACTGMTVELGGGFAVSAPSAEDQVRANVPPSTAVVQTQMDGNTAFAFAGGDERQARTAFVIEGLRDAWQYGYRRLNLWNAGHTAVNAFLLAQPNTVFLSDSMEPIKAPVRNRSIVAMHLSPPGTSAGNAYQVYSRLADYDARLQSRLITVSTFFGIGISLMVEGFILILLRVAKRFRSPQSPADDGDDER